MRLNNQDFINAFGLSGLLFVLQPLAVTLGLSFGVGASLLASLLLLNGLVFRLGRHYSKELIKAYIITSILSCFNYGIILSLLMYFNFPSSSQEFIEQVPPEMITPELEEQVSIIIEWVKKPILIATIIGLTNSIFAIPGIAIRYYRYTK